MKHDPLLPPVRRRADTDDFAAAKASFAAGDGMDHIVVREWLMTWGTSQYKPLAEWLLDQDG